MFLSLDKEMEPTNVILIVKVEEKVARVTACKATWNHALHPPFCLVAVH